MCSPCLRTHGAGGSLLGEIGDWAACEPGKSPAGLAGSAPGNLHTRLRFPRRSAFWAERTPVHEAAQSGEIHQLQELIRNSASVNLVTYDSITPLQEASLHAQTRCVEILLATGAQELPCGSLSFVVSASVKLSAEQRWKRSPTSTSLRN
ncbi:60 kDa lysophospholipase-like [Crotalus adamanteus]|uniref:60 kDa lysophospholipase-like n=1 Tax=Crotalus adamanteus TaxID=8729 RepID=A0AAW1BDI3_CROAD